MSNWPLDGIIVFVLLVAGLICLIGHPLLNLRKSAPDVPDADGTIHMKPLPSTYAVCAGTVLVSLCVTYAAAQAGACFNMTAAENAQNRLIGLGLAAAFWLSSAYMFYLLLFTRFRFDRQRIYGRTPLAGETVYDFEAITHIGGHGHDLRLHFADGQKLTIGQSSRSGLPAFAAVLNSYVLRHSPPPPAPLQDAPFFETLAGQRVILGFFSLNENWLPQLRGEITGTFTHADVSGFKICSDDGRQITCPANLRGLGKLAPPPADTTAEDGTLPPDFSLACFIPANFPIPFDTTA